jgi:4-hydroxybenzoate polyprenyltransferase
MSLSPDQATSVLQDLAAVESHSQRVFAYREASPHLMLWGVLWAVGYGATGVTPQHRTAIWIAMLAIGSAGGFLIGLRTAVQRDARADALADPTRRRAVARLRARFGGIWLIGFAFIAAALAMMWPCSPRQVGAFIPLVVAAGYAVLGLWCGLRFVLVGAVLAVLTLGGFFLLPTQFALWMAAVGGGALVLGGSWLRQV